MPRPDPPAVADTPLTEWLLETTAHCERVQPDAHTPLILDDPTVVWLVEAGGMFVFTAVIGGGAPRGTRVHLLDAGAGECVFGFDPVGVPGNVGALAVVRWGTVLRRWPIAELREQVLAHPQSIARVVDQWIDRLSASVMRSAGSVAADVGLAAHKPVELSPLQRSAASAGILWVDIPSGAVLYNDIVVPVFSETSVLFPLTSRTSVTTMGGASGLLGVTPLPTTDIITSNALWSGLRVFQHTALRSEVVNGQLAAAEEFLRLHQKAEHVTAADDRAYGAIGAVLQGADAPAARTSSSMAAEPVLWAARLVAQASGLELVSPPGEPVQATFHDRISEIASLSGIKSRQVSLLDNWWQRDGGPLLGQHAVSEAPVALLPVSATVYDMVEPIAGSRTRVDAAVASQIAGVAYQLYRPLPSGPVALRGLIRFAARGIGSDLRTLLIAAGAVGLFGTVGPYLTGRILDAAIPQSDRGTLIGFALALAGVALGTAAFKLVQGIASVRLQTRMEASIQAAVWDRMLQLPASFFRAHSAGDLADRAAGVDAIQTLLGSVGITAILGAMSSLLFVVQMFAYDPRLALVGVALTLLFVAVSAAFGLVQVRFQRTEITLRGRIAGLVLNLISGVIKVRTTGTEAHAFRVWAEQFATQRRVAFRAGTVRAAAATFTTAFPVAASTVLFLTVMRMRAADEALRQPSMSMGEFIAFSTAFGLFLAAMQALGDASVRLLEIIPLYERLQPLLKSAPETDPSRVAPAALLGSIELSKVSFRYGEDGPWILRDVSLQIRPGEFVAFVGDSGSGKSTLLRLLLGFERCTHGTIYYDGQDINSLDLRLLRRQMGVVLQVSRVMPTDIYRNIVGISTRTVEDAWDAAEMAGLADDVRAMPMGLHTYVAEGGSTLSGGQRQRLLIARAIVNRPRLLFLDEATSALDNRTQSVVSESLERLDATRIVIAHRLSTIVNADRICVLDNAHIVEEGNYASLMAQDGLFARLARRQMA